MAPRVLIGTPAYGGMVHLSYVHSISEYHQAGLAFELCGMAGESLITRARNAIASEFYAQPEYTHLLFLDADVYLPATGLQRLLAHQVDVVGAAVPLKRHNPREERIFNVGRTLGEEGDLHEVTRIGTAALLLSRNAVDRLVQDAIAHERCYVRNRRDESIGPDRVHYDIFQAGVREGEYLSEDFWVCARLRDLGMQVWFDPEIATRHHGTREF